MVRFSARWDNGEMHPGHCSVFDCLQYVKTEGEGLVHFDNDSLSTYM